jgi:hypothetical protein
MIAGPTPPPAAPPAPRSYFTRGCARPGPGRPLWIAEVRSTPTPAASPPTYSVEVRIGNLKAVALDGVPRAGLERIEGLTDCLRLDRVVRLLNLKP